MAAITARKVMYCTTRKKRPVRLQSLATIAPTNQHAACSLLARWHACSACTTCSMRMLREPLTSTLATPACTAPAPALARRPYLHHAAPCAKCGHSALLCGPKGYRMCSIPACWALCTHLGVEGRALVAHLAHIAQHQQARARAARPARQWLLAPNRGWRCRCRPPRQVRRLHRATEASARTAPRDRG